MPLPYVYADFNAIEYLDNERSKAEMALTGYGTLSSLARQNLQLQEGMALVLFEPNNIECEVTVHFDCVRRDPAGRLGEWVARFDPQTVRDSVQPIEASGAHPCMACGQDFLAQQPTFPRNYMEFCSHCGVSVMAPMAAPKRAT